MANNQGILHLANEPGGVPFCRNRRAHMSTTPDKAASWPRICSRCAAEQKRRDEVAARRAAADRKARDEMVAHRIREEEEEEDRRNHGPFGVGN